MRIFVGMKALRGDPERQTLAECVTQALQSSGHEVFLAAAEIERRGITDPHAFMPFVRQEMQRCHAALILYDPDLRGGLIELGLAYALGLPIWLAALHSAAHISSSALGCADKLLLYRDPQHLAEQLETLTKEYSL